MESSLVESLTQELRRGTLTLCVLGTLNESLYGYLLQQRLADAGIAMEQNTMYPLLRRLERQGLLTSEWSVEESRPRRYYQITALGAEVLSALIDAWQEMNTSVHAIVRKEEIS